MTDQPSAASLTTEVAIQRLQRDMTEQPDAQRWIVDPVMVPRSDLTAALDALAAARLALQQNAALMAAAKRYRNAYAAADASDHASVDELGLAVEMLHREAWNAAAEHGRGAEDGA